MAAQWFSLRVEKETRKSKGRNKERQVEPKKKKKKEKKEEEEEEEEKNLRQLWYLDLRKVSTNADDPLVFTFNNSLRVNV